MARDRIHATVKQALVNDGWTITADPYEIEYEGVKVYADLAAEAPLAAEKAGRKIVVEIKSFLGRSFIHEFETALGQYLLYQKLLRQTAPEYQLYLAVSDEVYDDFFSLGGIRFIVQDTPLALLIVSTIILVIVVRLQLLSSGIATLIWLPIALGSLARIIWIREEHENDKYILNREKVIDIDKRPFGPESQRNAQLDKLQDVRFDQGYIESWLGFGDVIIETGGSGGKLTFHHVPDPENVARTITDYMTDFKKRERERAQQATVAMFKHYHDMQIVHDELVDKTKIDAAVSAKVAEYADKEIPAKVEREVASHVNAQVRRQVNLALRRSAARSRMLRRRSES